MSHPDYSLWNSPQSVHVHESSEGLPLIRLEGSFGSALFSPQGAHLIQFQPKSGREFLFLSSRSHLAPGKAIRGGIPVIFPWFGPRAGHPEAPMHGLVRTRLWQVDSIQVPETGPATIRFALDSDHETLSHWPHPFHLTLEFQLGATLDVCWEVRNTGESPFTFEQALHPYFPVSDIHSAQVTGLQGASYIDKADHLATKVDAQSAVSFSAETDRLYLDTTSPCTLLDPKAGHQLNISKTGSQSSVVWNPWIAKAAALSDLDDSEWMRFVCVEQANAASNAVTLPPGGAHFFTAHYDFSDSSPV